MHVRCEHCGLDMVASAQSVGKMLRCPECGKTFICQLPAAIIVADDGQAGPAEELILDDEVAQQLEQEVLELTEEATEEPSPLEQLGAEASADDALSQLSKGKPKRIYKESPRQWYILVGGVAAVALTYQELKHKAAIGLVKPKTKIYYDPKDLTLLARDIPGLFVDEDVKRKEASKPKVRRRLKGEAAAEADELASALGGLGGQESGQGTGGKPSAQAGAGDAAPAADDAAKALDELGAAAEQASDKHPKP